MTGYILTTPGARTLDEVLADQLRGGFLTAVAGVTGIDEEFPVDDWGVRVKVVGDTWVYIHRMVTNWRVIEIVPDVPTYHPFYPATRCRRAWCYHDHWLTAVLAAVAWDAQPDTEPAGWAKQAGTERRNGEPTPGIRQIPYRAG